MHADKEIWRPLLEILRNLKNIWQLIPAYNKTGCLGNILSCTNTSPNEIKVLKMFESDVVPNKPYLTLILESERLLDSIAPHIESFSDIGSGTQQNMINLVTAI